MIKPRIGVAALRVLVLCVSSFFIPIAWIIAQSTDSTPTSPAASSSRIPDLHEDALLRDNDVVKIIVYGEDDLTTETRIEADGTIRFPLLGSVSLAGKTVGHATEEIHDLLIEEHFIKNPQVILTVTSHAKQLVTLLGEVKQPGEVAIPDEGSLDLLGAVALAGGFTDIAELSHITVRRLVGGKVQIMEVDAKKLAHDSTVKDFYVQSGDTITVRQRIF